MPSKKTTLRLGERTDAQVARLTERLGLTQADLHRAALHHFEVNTQMVEEIEAYAAARRLIDGLTDQWRNGVLQVSFSSEEDTPDAVVTLHARDGSPPQPLEMVLKAAVRWDANCAAVDLIDPETGVIIHDVWRRELDRDSGEQGVAFPLRAIHLHNPIPPIVDEMIVDGHPDGKEMTVYQPDGTAVRYVMREGRDVAVMPHRRASFNNRAGKD